MTQRMSMEEYRRLSKSDRRADQSPRKQEEHSHQAAYFSILAANQREFPFLEFIFAVPNAAKRNPSLANFMVSEGLKSGVPDIIFPFQRRGYPGAYMENKFGNNKLSDTQKKFRDHLLSEGYCFKTCYSAGQQIEFTEWFLGIELVK